MTLYQTTTTLAAGVGPTKVAPKPQGGGQRCTRRPGSRYTTCRCEPCLVLTSRTDKARRAGLLPPLDQAAALAQVHQWIRDGWAPSAVASATGLHPDAARQLLIRVRGGQTILLAATVRRVLAASPEPTGNVAAAGSTRRLQALAWVGWGRAELSAHTGIARRTLSCIRQGQHKNVTLPVARAIAQAYAELADKPGPSDVARADARRANWAPPAAWDDIPIDDPDSTPEGSIGPRGRGQGGPPRTDSTVIDRVQDLVRAGRSDGEIALDIGRSRDAVSKLRDRYGIRRAA